MAFYINSLNQKIASFNVGGYETFSLQFILGLLFAPLSWLMGVAKEDVILVGQLLGEKTILNEFVAYGTLGTYIDDNLLIPGEHIVRIFKTENIQLLDFFYIDYKTHNKMNNKIELTIGKVKLSNLVGVNNSVKAANRAIISKMITELKV